MAELFNSLDFTTNVAKALGGSYTEFSIKAYLQSRGCVLLGPERAESLESARRFIVEDSSGVAVNEVSHLIWVMWVESDTDEKKKIKYNTKYRMRNEANALFVDGHWYQYHRFAYANPNRTNSYYLVFKNPTGSLLSDVVPEGGLVNILFYDCDNDTEKGYLSYRFRDNKFAYLFIAPSSNSKVTLVMKYK